jgi:RHS repeat-associated protein
VTHFRHGPCRRLLEAIDGVNGVVKYVWGTEPGWLEQIINERGEQHVFFRDGAGQIVRQKDFDGRVQHFRYDNVGNCIRVTNGNDETISITYDHASRVLTQIASDGVFSRYEYGPTGHLASAVNQNISVTFVRDALGRILREIQGDYSIERRYDANGNAMSVQASIGLNVDYEFDQNNLLVGLKANGDSLKFERDVRGLELSRSMPSGVRMSKRYDVAGRLLEQVVVAGDLVGSSSAAGTSASRRLVNRAYAYDGAGALMSMKDGRWGATDYAYDPSGRVVQAVAKTGASERCEYDATGNVVASTYGVNDEISELSHHGPGSRLTKRGAVSYEYDAHGRLTSRRETRGHASEKAWHYRWNALDQLIEITRPDHQVWQYKYDALGLRIEKRGPTHTQKFVWDGNVPIHAVSSDGSRSSWIFEPGRHIPLALIENARLYSVITDHLGTPRELIDPVGRVAWGARYRVWGQVETTLKGEVTCPLRFQGQWHDEESGLSYNRYRYYDPDSRRFISSDPIGIRGGLNAFIYPTNPVNRVDPWGLCPNSVPPGGPGSGPHTHGPDEPPLTGGAPNGLHTRTSGDGSVAVQNTVYDHQGNAVAHVDFKPHGGGTGVAPSGHAHEFPPGGPPASGHGPGATHIPPSDVPPDWSRTPPGVPPAYPIGATTK